MIAVYTYNGCGIANCTSGRYKSLGLHDHHIGIHILPVKNDSFNDFLKLIESAPAPFPSDEVVFIENDIEVNRWNPYE